MVSREHLIPTRSVLLRIVLSLLLALLLWSWVTSLTDPDGSRSASDMTVSTGIPPEGLVVPTTDLTASVVASGPQSVVNDLTTSSLALTLDLNGISQPGSYTVDIEPVHRERFVTYQITPPTASIVVDTLDTSVVPLTPQQKDSGDQSGRRIASVSLSSPEVTISGPHTVVSAITSAGVDIDTAGQTGTFTVRVGTYAVTNQGNRIDANSGSITISPPFVNANVQLATAGKEVTILPNVMGNPASGFEQRITTTTPRTVVVDGPASALASLSYVGTTPVDISGATQTVSQSVAISGLPAGVHVTQPASGEVTIIVQIQQQNVDQTLPSLPVQIAGLAPGLTAAVNPASVSIEIAASSQQIPSLVAGGIVVSVDVSGRGPGTYMLTPNVSVPSGVEWDTIAPAQVQVTVSGGSGTPVATTPAEAAVTPAGTPRAT